MKNLELNQMEKIEGGVNCTSWLGLAFGFAVAGILIGVTAGAGAPIVGALLSAGALEGATQTCTV